MMKLITILAMLACSAIGQDHLNEIWWHQSATAALAWTPSNSLASFAGWWDAANVSSIQKTVNAVTNWIDISGNSKDMTEAGTTANRPASGTRTHDGKNVLDCDGGDFLTAYTVAISTNGNAIFAMVTGVDAINNTADSIFSTSSGGANRFQLDTTNAAAYYPQLNQTSMGASDIVAGSAYAGPSIYIVYLDRSGGTYSVWVDGTKVAGDGSYTASITSPNQVFMFRNNGSAQYPDGFCAEFLIANIANTSTRQKIEGYLAWKWGLEGNLPVGHPYKNSAPTQ